MLKRDMEDKKVLFVLKPHSVIDVITNSSSELFVGKSQSLTIMKELISHIYSDYLSEYEEFMTIDQLTIEKLNNFMEYYCSPGMWPAPKSMYPIYPGFTFDELYEVDDYYNHRNEVSYRLKNNVINPTNRWDSSFITEENFEEMKNRIDPDRTMFFLYSLGDNPNWDKQEMLMDIMERYHLG